MPRGSRITTCSGAQSPEMLGSPLGRRGCRLATFGALTCPRTSLISLPAFTYWPYRSMRLPFANLMVLR